jgi:hypothetical protein
VETSLETEGRMDPLYEILCIQDIASYRGNTMCKSPPMKGKYTKGVKIIINDTMIEQILNLM